MEDLTNRYACSLYVDLRLGIIPAPRRKKEDPAEHSPSEAWSKTAQVYGGPAATYAKEVCN